MSFDTAWLDLREGADAKARDADIRARVLTYLSAQSDPLIVDLGAGTGSTMRALDFPSARWRLIDNDPGLLAEAARRGRPGVETVELDLTKIDDIPLHGATLVTASALFDLASPAWIDALANRLAARNIGLYAALSYDGILDWQPADPDDLRARDGFNLHQRNDKGFGPALGPFGASYLAEAMRRHGYAVATASSPWVLDRSEAPLQRALLTGIAEAACASGMDQADDWLKRRLASTETGICTVGHLDVLALPA